MNEPDTSAFDAASERLSSWRRPLLITHAKPDGDALGALVAMRSFLRRMGMNPTALLFDPVPDRYGFMEWPDPLTLLGRDAETEDLSERDAVMILDTCAVSQLYPLMDWLRASPLPKLVVDHHVTRDDIADHYLVDEGAAATCLILHDWARAAGWTVCDKTASSIFTGIATDTGWFHHANTDERALAAAGELVRLGASPNALYEQLYQRETPARFRLRSAAGSRLELLESGRFALMAIPRKLFRDCQASLTDTEDLVNEPLRIESVVVCILLAEQDDHMVRVSFRSRQPTSPQVPDVDVAALAATFGGGGHRRAAGARIEGTSADVRRRIVEGVKKALGDASQSPEHRDD